jgi:hypothetical protein
VTRKVPADIQMSVRWRPTKDRVATSRLQRFLRPESHGVAAEQMEGHVESRGLFFLSRISVSCFIEAILYVENRIDMKRVGRLSTIQ